MNHFRYDYEGKLRMEPDEPTVDKTFKRYLLKKAGIGSRSQTPTAPLLPNTHDDGRTLTKTNPGGDVESFAYDGAGKLVGKEYPSGLIVAYCV